MQNYEQKVTYPFEAPKERLPTPKFPESAYWQGIPEEDEIVGQRVTLNGEEYVFEVVGFQGSDAPGYIADHQERRQKEGAFFISGEGKMTKRNGEECQRRPDDPVSWERPLNGPLTLEEARQAKYTLAVASKRSPARDEDSGREMLVLNIETADGRTIAMEGEWLPIGWWHSTQLNGETLYFVVKLSRYVQDTHEVVGYAGPYGGGSDG